MLNAQYTQQQQVNSFMQGVYGWMSAALAITAGVAYLVSSTPTVFLTLQANPALVIGLFVLQIAIVMGLSGWINKMSFSTALALFLTYAATLGVSLSVILYIYTSASIAITFLTTATMFGVMSLYGHMTKADLTSVGSISIMMLWGIIIASIINLFFRSSMMDMILSGIGVVIFTLLTAYDSQKIKRIAQSLNADQETMAKVSLMGALTLYLDFINLFLYLLRFMGKRRND